ncbi:MAG: hypothetical protein JEY99_11845 [Spirochaetales bacterium]|nr:hypothetical protein [Spirochaetales bacterium]
MNLKRIPLIIMLFVAVVLSFSCATMFTKGGGDYRAAKKSYESKSYGEALTKVLTALGKNPEFPEALELMHTTFDEGNSEYLSIIEAGKDLENPMATRNAFDAARKLVALNTIASDSGRRDLSATDYSSELKTVREMMLESNFNYGTGLLATGDVRSAREAVSYFTFVNDEESDYNGSAIKIIEAREAGIVHVAFDLPMDFLYYTVLTQFEDNEYVKIATLEDYPGNNMVGPLDQMMNDLSAGNLDFVIRADTKASYSWEVLQNDGMVPTDTIAKFPGKLVNCGYSNTSEMTYTVYGKGNTVVDEKTLNDSQGDSLEFCFIPFTEEHKGIYFDGVGYDFRALVSDGTHGYYEDGQVMVNGGMQTYDVSDISNPYDNRFWLDYFRANFDGWVDFYDLKNEFDGGVFINASVLYEASSEGYRPVFTSDDPVQQWNNSINMGKAMHSKYVGLVKFMNEYLAGIETGVKDSCNYDLVNSMCENLKSIL